MQPIKDDEFFITDMKERIQRQSARLLKIFILVFFVMLVTFVLWAHFSVIEEITVATGKVIPSSQVKHIQNLEGGILKRLFVKEGQTIKKGQSLALLDDTKFLSEFRQEKARKQLLQASIARLDAEINDAAEVTFVRKDNIPQKIKKRQIDLFNSRKQKLKEKITTIERSAAFAEKELKITRPLVQRGIMSKLELYQLERKANELRGAILDERQKYKKESEEELKKNHHELAILEEKMHLLQDRLKRTLIKSPVAGVVKQINVNTVGGVIKPGDDIMEIVPIEDSLLVEARVLPKDIAFVYPGQKALVKISSYDFTIYGGIEGKVVHVGADTQMTQDEQSYYEVWVKTDKSYVGDKNKKLSIIPGMTVTAHIITGHRTILSYLLKPILRAKELALRER